MKTIHFFVIASLALFLFGCGESYSQVNQTEWRHFRIFADNNSDTVFKFIYDLFNIEDCVKSKTKYQLVVNLDKDGALIVGKFDSKDVELDREACRWDNSSLKKDWPDYIKPFKKLMKALMKYTGKNKIQIK